MRYAPWLLAAALVGSVGAPATPLRAQEEEPELRYLTVTTFHVPYDAEAQEMVSWWVDSVMVPTTNMDPHVLSARMGTHLYGSHGGDVIMITEYADWDAINADCEPCTAWFEDRQPEEGTPEREVWDKAQAMFMKYFTGHRDEIYVVDMSRAK